MHCQLHEIPPYLRGSSKRVADVAGSVRSKFVPVGFDHRSKSDTVDRCRSTSRVESASVGGKANHEIETSHLLNTHDLAIKDGMLRDLVRENGKPCGRRFHF